MAWLETAYTLGLTALRPALAVAARGEGKLARGARGRRDTIARLTEWSPARDLARPLVWFHAPSVGEGLQARSVLERFLGRRPDAQIVYTFFSPSAEALAAAMPADVTAYLPFDVPRDTGRALDLLRPDGLVFSKTDVWPNLTREAQRRGVPLSLLSATLPPSSSRLRGPARALLGPAYRRLDRVAAISAADAHRFESLGVDRGRISVMGDAHFDRVLARAGRVRRDSPLLHPLAAPADAVTLVAGSTWAADEERLLPLLHALRRESAPRRVRLLLVPHEPTPEHIAQSQRRMTDLGLTHRLLSGLGDAWNGAEVLLVDRLGVLGELYAIADLAYVGGGWGRAGLHSVLEPAAFGIPVVFGPRHGNAREAGELVARGGAFSVAPGGLHRVLSRLLISPEARGDHGAAARAYVEEGRGAAERGAALVEELIAASQRV